MANYETAANKYNRIILQKYCKNETDECSICLDSLYLKAVSYLPCKHFFHQSCLNQAFEKKLYTCPLCRYDLIEPLIKTNFKFPELNDPYTYPGRAYAYTGDAYRFNLPYTYYDDYDDMPDLVESENDDLSIWYLLFNTLQNEDAVQNVDAPLQNVDAVQNDDPVQNVDNLSATMLRALFFYDI